MDPMKTLTLLTCIFLLLSSDSFAESCNRRYSAVNLDERVAKLPTENGTGFFSGKKILRVQPNATGLLPAQAIGGESDLFVGFLNGHPYVVAGNQRFDGNSFFKASKTLSSPALHEGIVVRVRDKQIKDNLERYLEKKTPLRELNCVVGACKVLRQGGDMRFQKGNVSFYTPQNLLRALVTKPIKGSNGENPPIEIFVIGSGNVDNQIALMKEVSLREGASLAQMVAGTLAITGIVGYGASAALAD